MGPPVLAGSTCVFQPRRAAGQGYVEGLFPAENVVKPLIQQAV